MEPPEFPKQTTLRPDILIFSFAGGFHDPEGFLTVITAMLGADLKTVLNHVYPLYLEASADSDWQTRSIKYQEINRRLLSEHVLVPGWRPSAEILRQPFITLPQGELRYSPRLKDYSIRKEEI